MIVRRDVLKLLGTAPVACAVGPAVASASTAEPASVKPDVEESGSRAVLILTNGEDRMRCVVPGARHATFVVKQRGVTRVFDVCGECEEHYDFEVGERLQICGIAWR